MLPLNNLKLIFLIALSLFIVGNLIFLDYKQLSSVNTSQQSSKESQTSLSSINRSGTEAATPSSTSDSGRLNASVVANDSCGPQCQALIDQKIATLKKDLLSQISKQTTTKTTSTSTNSPKEVFINFGVNGSTTNTAWTDLAGSIITFDISSYPGVKAIYFQANLKSDAPDRSSYARIYDANHFVGVQDSEISHTSLTSKLIESGPLTFLSGKINLNVQIHSLNGNLSTVENPRLRIVY